MNDADYTRIAELEAELAAVPKWTRITDDPATWPPNDRSKVVNCFPSFNGNWEYEVRSSDYFRLAIEGMIPLEYPEYWLPITPPTEADNE